MVKTDFFPFCEGKFLKFHGVRKENFRYNKKVDEIFK